MTNKLKWFTTDKPLEDGWYWIRDYYGIGRGSGTEITMVQARGRIIYELNEGYEINDINFLSLFEFAGPIQEPEE